MQQVSDTRRAGDADGDQKVIADKMKLIGNSGYDSLIMDKERHQDISLYGRTRSSSNENQ